MEIVGKEMFPISSNISTRAADPVDNPAPLVWVSKQLLPGNQNLSDEPMRNTDFKEGTLY
jgi:hypothetical protein